MGGCPSGVPAKTVLSPHDAFDVSVSAHFSNVLLSSASIFFLVKYTDWIHVQSNDDELADTVVMTRRAKLSGAVCCNRSCLWVYGFVCVFVGLLPR